MKTHDVGNAFDDLVARAESDQAVLGLVLTGSRAREGAATAYSDTDVYVIVDEYAGPWLHAVRTPELDTIPLSMADLADRSDRWQRYSFRGARVLLDRCDGRIDSLVAAQATLSAEESDAWVREELDGYVNFVYRAAKSRRDGRPDLARLDEAEAASWFLWTLFALYGRVRPYNKYLRWELENFPLPDPWTADYLIPMLTTSPSALFPSLEADARAKGFADILDAWDDLSMLRVDGDGGDQGLSVVSEHDQATLSP